MHTGKQKTPFASSCYTLDIRYNTLIRYGGRKKAPRFRCREKLRENLLFEPFIIFGAAGLLQQAAIFRCLLQKLIACCKLLRDLPEKRDDNISVCLQVFFIPEFA